ncbi:MAG: hypothetical protein HC908_11195, partial [Calothrix sp. SM1_7_51]|nr:hypothetical protein [Calothrix sp. SM1_7_51]
MATKFVKHIPLTQKFETEKKINKITSPLLIAASKNDTTIPYQMSKQLASINQRAKLFISDKGSHHNSEWLLKEAVRFLNSLTSDNKVSPDGSDAL